VPGTEYGIEFAERLAAAFGTPTNPSRSVERRRNKYAMIQALHQAGIPCARQQLCRSEAEVRAACAEIGGRLVVKPIDSAGSDGIHFCDAPEQAVEAFRALTARQTLLDGAIREVVVQSYLDGTEYYVNTMSRQGVHRVAEFWEITHVAANGRSNLLDSAILMPGDGEIQRALADYAASCLDALEVTDSPAHLEIRMTSKGPKLVELGARIVGGPLSRIARLGLAQSQLDLIAEGYCDERTFLTRPHEPYSVSTFVAAVAFISGRSGVLRAYPRLDEVRTLESFHELMELVAPGSRIERTHNDFTYPLMMILAHPDRAAVSRDSRAIRHLDGADFYDIAS
jgi:biotin carboxylase